MLSVNNSKSIKLLQDFKKSQLILSIVMSIEIYDYEELDLMQKNGPKFSNQPKNPNRLYLSWKNSQGNECKMIGPETKCFCNHRFKEHQHLNPVNGKTVCCAKGCKCKTFEYIPTHGAYDFKCLCKHSFKQHDRNSKACLRQKCANNCSSFGSAWTCSCGQKYDKHTTVSQTLEQRKKQGKQTNDMSRMASELQSNVKEGSLYRPIKADRESKFKRYSEVIGRDNIVNRTLKQIENEGEDEIEEIDFKRNGHLKRNN